MLSFLDGNGYSGAPSTEDMLRGQPPKHVPIGQCADNSHRATQRSCLQRIFIASTYDTRI